MIYAYGIRIRIILSNYRFWRLDGTNGYFQRCHLFATYYKSTTCLWKPLDWWLFCKPTRRALLNVTIFLNKEGCIASRKKTTSHHYPPPPPHHHHHHHHQHQHQSSTSIISSSSSSNHQQQQQQHYQHQKIWWRKPHGSSLPCSLIGHLKVPSTHGEIDDHTGYALNI